MHFRNFGFISIYKKTTSDILSISLFEGFSGSFSPGDKEFSFNPSFGADLTILSIRNSWAIDIGGYIEIEAGIHIRFGYIDFVDLGNSRLIRIEGIYRIQPNWEALFEDLKKGWN